MSTPEALISLLQSGPLSAAEIGARLGGISQPGVSRLVAKAGDAVLRIGRARATRYAARRRIPGLGLQLPVYAIDEAGAVHELGMVHGLAGGQFAFVGPGCPAVYLGEAGNGLFDGLPFFLRDLRPQGFMGRAIAAQLPAALEYPRNPADWSSDQVLRYLSSSEGWNLLGNLLVGDAALNGYMRAAASPMMDRPVDFPLAAQRAMSGEPPGSSAGGEQPKFLGVTDRGPVLVKFSPEGDLPASVRWQDLLFAEHHALETLRRSGIETASNAVWRFGGRVFLESCRFDRTPHGRAPMLSLSAVDAEFAGIGSHWGRSVEALVTRRVLAPGEAARVVFAHTFGEWIGNTDMHLGNLSFRPNGSHFELLPIYDMLPMRLIPRYNEVTPYTPITPPAITAGNRSVWHETGRMAAQFWAAVAADPQVSPDFRAIAENERAAIETELARAPRLVTA